MLPENWDAVRVFLAAQTQWRTGPAGYVGLDYAAVRAALRAVRADGGGMERRGRRLRWRRVFAGVGAIEAAVLKELDRRATADEGRQW